MTRRSLFVLAVLLSALPARAQVPAGPEFQVNVYTTSRQDYPSVAMDAAGNFVVAWEDGAGLDGSGFSINARRFDALGQPRGEVFQVNSYTTGPQYSPAVFGDPRGGFVVAWTSFIGGRFLLEAQRYDPAGQALGGEFRVSSTDADYQDNQVMAFDRGGSFVVAWRAQGTDGSATGIVARRFDAAGSPLGADFVVNTTTAGVQQWPAALPQPGGGFVIAWSGYSNGGGRPGALAQRFDAAGSPVGGEFNLATVGEDGQGRPSMVGTPDGGFAAAWMGADGSGVGIVARRFDAQGAPRSGQFPVNMRTDNQQFFPWTAGDSTGDFTVVWADYHGGAEGFDLTAARFDASGQRRGADFLVNTFTQGDQYPNRAAPTLAADPSGNFVVVWTSVGQDRSGSYGVFAQRYGGLFPAGLAVDQDSGRDGVLEPGETVSVRPSWRNVSGAPQPVIAALASLTGPAGATYTIVDGNGAYGTVANGATAPCTDCFSVTVSAPAGRPATHWDAVGTERLAPDAQGQVMRWPLHVGASFGDVPAGSGFHRYVETLLHRGVTAGCNADHYCPGLEVTRAQMAVFVLVSKEGPAYLPPACAAPTLFDDLPAGSAYCRWVEELARRGVTGGCGGGNYCPTTPVSREQMAVFLTTTFGLTLYGP